MMSWVNRCQYSAWYTRLTVKLRKGRPLSQTQMHRKWGRDLPGDRNDLKITTLSKGRRHDIRNDKGRGCWCELVNNVGRRTIEWQFTVNARQNRQPGIIYPIKASAWSGSKRHQFFTRKMLREYIGVYARCHKCSEKICRGKMDQVGTQFSVRYKD